MHISDITDGELPSTLSGLGLGAIFDDSPASKPLSRGAQGPRVKEMQTLFNTFDYKLAVDGIFGRGTEAAVKFAQSKLGMAQTGVYDKALDTRIRGITQSGIINPSPAEQKALAAAGDPTRATGAGPGAAPGASIVPTGVQPTTPAAPGTLTVTQDGQVVTAEPSFMDAVKNFVTAPNFKFYIAGAVVLLVGAVLYFGPKAKPAPVQVLGLGKLPSKKRKARKKKATKAAK